MPDGVLLPEQVGHGRAHGGREDILRRGRGGGIHHTGLEIYFFSQGRISHMLKNKTGREQGRFLRSDGD